jgi:hypothetical protein
MDCLTVVVFCVGSFYLMNVCRPPKRPLIEPDGPSTSAACTIESENIADDRRYNLVSYFG